MNFRITEKTRDWNFQAPEFYEKLGYEKVLLYKETVEVIVNDYCCINCWSCGNYFYPAWLFDMEKTKNISIARISL